MSAVEHQKNESGSLISYAETARLLGMGKFTLQDVMQLINHSKSAATIRGHLSAIGEYTDTDRVYIFMNHLAPDMKTVLFSQIYEWTQDGITPEMDNPILQGVPYHEEAPRWFEELSQGRVINGEVKDFPESERATLEPQGIKSLVAVPITVDGVFWGLIGLDSVREVRVFTTAEEGLLRIIADDLGMMLSRAILEQRLQEAEQDILQLVDVLPMGVVMVDQAGDFIYRNQTFRDTYKWDESQINRVDEWFEKAYEPHRREEAKREFAKSTGSLESRSSFTNPQPFPVLCADGTVRVTEFRLVNAGDNVAVILTDVSDRIHLEEMRAKLEAQERRNQRQQVASLERMAGSIAHVFNNQLSVIMGALDLITNAVGDDPGLKDDLEMAQVATRRAADVSSSMLTYLGEGLEKIEVVELSGFCRDCIKKARKLLSDKTDWIVQIPAGNVKVRANPNRLRQILQNLLQNAQESMAGGVITVKLEVKESEGFTNQGLSMIPIEWTPSTPRYVQISIEDQGIGIPEEDFYRIFEPFFSTKFHGRGMGLAVASGYLKAWQGAISVSSELGRGSIFTIYLPVVEDAAADESAPPEKETAE